MVIEHANIYIYKVEEKIGDVSISAQAWNDAVKNSHFKYYRDKSVDVNAPGGEYGNAIHATSNDLSIPRHQSDVMQQVRQVILSALPFLGDGSEENPPYSYHVGFDVAWDPIKFVKEQDHGVPIDEVVEKAITLTGTPSEAQALSCAEYLRQTWPASGNDIAQMAKDAIKSPNSWTECKIKGPIITDDYANHTFADKRPDDTVLFAQVKDARFLVHVIGNRDSITEIGEQLAWLVSALRTVDDTGMSLCTPVIRNATSDQATQLRPPTISTVLVSFLVDVVIDTLSPPETSAGKCWHDLFINPTLVNGYPIRPRPKKCTPNLGLEISLDNMCFLARARRITVLAGKLFLRGLRAMLFPTETFDGMIVWHMIYDDEGKLSDGMHGL